MTYSCALNVLAACVTTFVVTSVLAAWLGYTLFITLQRDHEHHARLKESLRVEQIVKSPRSHSQSPAPRRRSHPLSQELD